MDYVPGQALDARLAGLQGQIPRTLAPKDLAPGLVARNYTIAVLQVGQQLAGALHHAHQRGVLHRDVKPSNVLLSEEGRAVLVDFGLHALQAEDGTEAASRLTREGSAPGTLLYMAPEQLSEGLYDVRSEVYALGATLYELLALHPPFQGKNRSSTERLILAGGASNLRSKKGGVAPDVDAVIQRALSPDPARRYVDMHAFADDLQRLIERKPVAARPDSLAYRLRRWATRQPALAAVSGLLAFLLVAIPSVWIVNQERNNRDLRQALDREKEARATEEDLSRYVISVLESADPNLNEPSAATRQILERGVTQLEQRLSLRPLRQAEVRRVLGRIHSNLALWESADQLLHQSLETWTTEHQRRHSEGAPEVDIRRALDQVVESRSVLALFLENRNRLAEALPHRMALEQDIATLSTPNSWRSLHARANWMRIAQLVQGMPDGQPVPTAEAYKQALREAVEAIDSASISDPVHAEAPWGGSAP